MWSILSANPKWITILVWTLSVLLGGGIALLVYKVRAALDKKKIADLENENARLRVLISIGEQIKIGADKWEKIKQDLNSAADAETFIQLWNKHLEELRKSSS